MPGAVMVVTAWYESSKTLPSKVFALDDEIEKGTALAHRHCSTQLKMNTQEIPQVLVWQPDISRLLFAWMSGKMGDTKTALHQR
jgi:hypothetical protein